MKPRKEFQALLARKKLKKTSQRELIWGILMDSKGHPSVEEIRDRLLTKGHRIGIATIYRTLKILLTAGMIRQSKLNGMTRYEAVVKEPNHLHFICNACKRTVEFPSSQIEDLLRKVTTEYGFQERYSRYMILGICRACQRKQEKASAISERLRLEKTAIRDALELTLAVERLGLTFYTNASKKTKNDSGRTMFRRLAAEESDHLRRLQAEHRSLLEQYEWLKREPARLPISKKIAQEIFPHKELLRLQVTDEMTELEALVLAMDLERRSHEFFQAFANQLTDPNGRKAFLDFAKAEETHLEELRAEYAAAGGKER
jgi:Fur family transcriptional regulator, ferric uptake regulator